jgi:hypothetical protein
MGSRVENNGGLSMSQLEEYDYEKPKNVINLNQVPIDSQELNHHKLTSSLLNDAYSQSNYGSRDQGVPPPLDL